MSEKTYIKALVAIWSPKKKQSEVDKFFSYDSVGRNKFRHDTMFIRMEYDAKNNSFIPTDRSLSYILESVAGRIFSISFMDDQKKLLEDIQRATGTEIFSHKYFRFNVDTGRIEPTADIEKLYDI